MRIAIVNSARGRGGGMTAARQLGLGLAEAGHEVTVVCHPRSALRDSLEDGAPFEIAPVAIRAELNPLRVAQLARLFRRVRPDAVIADRRKDVKLSALARWLVADVPLVHRHGAPSALKDSAIYRFFWTRGVQGLVVLSWTMRDRLLERAPWLRRTPIKVIHNGIDVRRYRPIPEARSEMRRSLGIDDDAFVVSCHAMLQPRKQVDVLIRAVAGLAGEVHVQALIVGGGPQTEELKRLAGSLRAPVTFTGPRDDITELLAAADVAAHLSVAEGFSNSVLESMACALPVIVSDATSHPEQIQDGVHGRVVPPGRPEGAADAIRWLAAHPDARARIGRAAQRRALDEFSRDAMIARYDAFIRELVAAREGR